MTQNILVLKCKTNTYQPETYVHRNKKQKLRFVKRHLPKLTYLFNPLKSMINFVSKMILYNNCIDRSKAQMVPYLEKKYGKLIKLVQLDDEQTNDEGKSRFEKSIHKHKMNTKYSIVFQNIL